MDLFVWLKYSPFLTELLKFGRVRYGIHISSTIIFFLHFSEKERFSIKKDDFAYLGRRNAKHSKQERNGQPSFTDDSCGVTFGRHDGSFHFSSTPPRSAASHTPDVRPTYIFIAVCSDKNISPLFARTIVAFQKGSKSIGRQRCLCFLNSE